MADRVHVDRNAAGLNRYTLDDSTGLWLIGVIDFFKAEVEAGRLEQGKAHELFRRELRLFVPESAVQDRRVVHS